MSVAAARSGSNPAQELHLAAEKPAKALAFLPRARDAIAARPSVGFPVGGLRAENNSFEGPWEKPFHLAHQCSVSGRPKTSTATKGASMTDLEIMWTKVDEDPALATLSLLPIVEDFVGAAGVSVTLKDISMAGRIIAN